jgi:hypothetical protein
VACLGFLYFGFLNYCREVARAFHLPEKADRIHPFAAGTISYIPDIKWAESVGSARPRCSKSKTSGASACADIGSDLDRAERAPNG